MSAEYPGIPEVTRQYWYEYLWAIFGMFTVLLFTGSAAGILVYLFLSSSIDLFVLAALSLILHSAAWFIKDSWSGRFEPDQTHFNSTLQQFAFIVVLGVLESTLLLIAASGAHLLRYLVNVPEAVVLLFAVYYPIFDIAMMRRGYKTPAATTMIGAIILLGTVIDMHRSIVDVMPVIGVRRRPPS